MKTKIIAMLLFSTITFGCNETRKRNDLLNNEMIKITIMYPNGDGAYFNMNYYKNKHMPMLTKLFGDSMKKYEIDEGIRGRTAEDEITYLAIGYLYFDSISEYEQRFVPNAKKILGDITNYTNIKPFVQINRTVK